MLQENRCNPIQSGFILLTAAGFHRLMRGSLTWHVLSLSHIQFASPRTLRSLKQDQAHRGPPQRISAHVTRQHKGHTTVRESANEFAAVVWHALYRQLTQVSSLTSEQTNPHIVNPLLACLLQSLCCMRTQRRRNPKLRRAALKCPSSARTHFCRTKKKRVCELGSFGKRQVRIQIRLVASG